MWETPIFLHIWHVSSAGLQSSWRYLSVPLLSGAAAVPAPCDYTGGVWLRSPGMLQDVVASSVLAL